MLTLSVIARGETRNKVVLEPGMVVEYCGHIPGGNVAIKIDGKSDEAHPFCFKELR